MLCRSLRISFLFILLTSIVSCKTVSSFTPTPETPALSWSTRKARLDKIKHWNITGKIAVQTTKDSGSGNINWVQFSDRYHIALFGTLNSNQLELYGQKGSVTLITPQGKRLVAKSPEELLAKQWGFKVPVENLKYWIRGLPAPGPYNAQFDRQNRIVQLTQGNYHIEFLNYENVSTIDLPIKLVINSPHLKIKMMIYQWKVL